MWNSIDKPIPDNTIYGGKNYIVTVVCRTWDKPATMVMKWECALIRKKIIRRWKWENRMKDNDWIVTHWMELPEPVSV